MAEPEKKVPDNNLERKENGDQSNDLLKNKKEAQHQIESEAVKGLNSIKESLAQNNPDSILEVVDWLGGN